MIQHAFLPLTLWDEIFFTTKYLINRIPSSSHNQPPLLCFPYLRSYMDHKLEPRSSPCVFIGYAVSQKGYKCLELSTNRIYISRHVVFNEQQFLYVETRPVQNNSQLKEGS